MLNLYNKTDFRFVIYAIFPFRKAKNIAGYIFCRVYHLDGVTITTAVV